MAGSTSVGEVGEASVATDTVLPGRVAEPDSPIRRAFDKRWIYEVAYACIVVGAAALILSLVGRHSGWPLGGQYFNELLLVPIYAAHFRHLDLFPVWSSTDGLGFGTPVLLFYQKAFFYVAGTVFILLGGSLKPTLIISIAVFLVIGAYGMRRALTLVTESRLLQVLGSVGFLFTNYVFTDWLQRGDLPEFSAMMIVPWLLFCCLNLVKNRRVSLLFIPAVALLVEAHSAIALVSLFTLVIAFATFVVVAGRRGLREIALRLTFVVAAAVVVLAPTLLAELLFAQDYDPAKKVTYFGQNISTDYQPFGSYFVDSVHRWLYPMNHRFVQIDFSIWIPLVITLGGVAAYWRSRVGDQTVLPGDVRSIFRQLRFFSLAWASICFFSYGSPSGSTTSSLHCRRSTIRIGCWHSSRLSA